MRLCLSKTLNQSYMVDFGFELEVFEPQQG